MAKRKKSLKKDAPFMTLWSRLLPESVQSYIARRVYDLWALLLIGFGVFVTGAIITYSANDPSLNTAAPEEDIHNVFGYGGAIIADILVQAVGLTAIAIGIAFGIWGINTFQRKSQPGLGVRLLWLCGAVLLLSITFARVPAQILSNENFIEGTYLGGMIGSVAINTVSRPLGSILGGWEYTILAVLAGMAGICFVLKALNIPIVKLKAYIKAFLGFSLFVFKVALSGTKAFVSWIKHHNDPEYKPEAFQALKEQLAEKFQKDQEPSRKLAKTTTKSNTQEDRQTPETKKDQGGIQVVKPKSSTINTSKQGSFSLDDQNTDWELPPVDFLKKPDARNASVSPDDAGLRRNAEMLQSVLADFNVSGEIAKIHPGPVVTLYEFEPAPGVKSSRVINLSDDIARSMAALSVRVAVIPGRNVIGIE